MDECGNARTEFWQMLARSLLVPQDSAFRSAMRDDFAPDFESVARECGVTGLDEPLRRYRAEVATTGEGIELLAAYSRLFLTPPIPAPLDIGRHIDAMRAEESVRRMTRLMAHHGVAPAEAGRDAPAALPTLLEYLALRFDRPSDDRADIQELRLQFLLPASKRMSAQAREAEVEYGLPAVYSALLDIVVTALEDRDGRFFPPAPPVEDSPPADAPESGGVQDMIACRMCGQAIASASDFAAIAERLRNVGLPTSHLAVCPDCRGAPASGVTGPQRGAAGKGREEPRIIPD